MPKIIISYMHVEDDDGNIDITIEIPTELQKYATDMYAYLIKELTDPRTRIAPPLVLTELPNNEKCIKLLGQKAKAYGVFENPLIEFCTEKDLPNFGLRFECRDPQFKFVTADVDARSMTLDFSGLTGWRIDDCIEEVNDLLEYKVKTRVDRDNLRGGKIIIEILRDKVKKDEEFAKLALRVDSTLNLHHGLAKMAAKEVASKQSKTPITHAADNAGLKRDKQDGGKNKKGKKGSNGDGPPRNCLTM